MRYYETYNTGHIPLVKKAWGEVTSTEPIFRTRFDLFNDEYCLTEESDGPLYGRRQRQPTEGYIHPY